MSRTPSPTTGASWRKNPIHAVAQKKSKFVASSASSTILAQLDPDDKIGWRAKMFWMNSQVKKQNLNQDTFTSLYGELDAIFTQPEKEESCLVRFCCLWQRPHIKSKLELCNEVLCKKIDEVLPLVIANIAKKADAKSRSISTAIHSVENTIEAIHLDEITRMNAITFFQECLGFFDKVDKRILNTADVKDNVLLAIHGLRSELSKISIHHPDEAKVIQHILLARKKILEFLQDHPSSEVVGADKDVDKINGARKTLRDQIGPEIVAPADKELKFATMVSDKKQVLLPAQIARIQAELKGKGLARQTSGASTSGWTTPSDASTRTVLDTPKFEVDADENVDEGSGTPVSDGDRGTPASYEDRDTPASDESWDPDIKPSRPTGPPPPLSPTPPRM